jgi:hypothetical protein
MKLFATMAMVAGMTLTAGLLQANAAPGASPAVTVSAVGESIDGAQVEKAQYWRWRHRCHTERRVFWRYGHRHVRVIRVCR